ncbi:MAG: hypothetical protein HUJ31_07680 [Pseudomonadales bacterium]|nr:hypothetical protein [Pseudomonadales bacterium]
MDPDVSEMLQSNDAVLWWVILSVAAFLVTLIMVPLILIWMPQDYFLKSRKERPKMMKNHPAVSVTLVVIRNIIGYLFIAAGMVMLALPGQGMLTAFVGLLLINFPGKDRMIRWLISRGQVHHSIDWLRRKAGRKPLILGEEFHNRE